ncbi:hypothetical protein [Natronorarus salvus]|uniref:hypothetical protein n=1 Tax=Natronorarus salvus TaxID=3117733 RepID=UPI002F262EDF
MPLEMFLVFVATIAAGSLAAVHYLIVHVLMGRPPEENVPGSRRELTESSTERPVDD